MSDINNLLNKYKNLITKNDENNSKHKVYEFLYSNFESIAMLNIGFWFSMYLIALYIMDGDVLVLYMFGIILFILMVFIIVLCRILINYFDNYSHDSLIHKEFNIIKEYSLDTTNLISLLVNYESEIKENLFKYNFKIESDIELLESLNTLYLKDDYNISDENIKLILNRGIVLLNATETDEFINTFISQYKEDYNKYKNKNLNLSELNKIINQNY